MTVPRPFFIFLKFQKFIISQNQEILLHKLFKLIISFCNLGKMKKWLGTVFSMVGFHNKISILDKFDQDSIAVVVYIMSSVA